MISLGKKMKKKFLWIMLGLSATFAVSAHPLPLIIEDEGLAAVSDEISSMVYQDKSFDSFKNYSCKVVGEKAALSESAAVEAYFLTTADACGWGAAFGPMWLVRTSGGRDPLCSARAVARFMPEGSEKLDAKYQGWWRSHRAFRICNL